MPPVPRLAATSLLPRPAPSSASQPAAASNVLSDFDVPESQVLFLPSQLSQDDLDLCALGLAEIENRLCEGQLHDSLDKIQVQLHVKSRLLNFKGRHVRHQGLNTTMRHRLDVNDAKIIALAERY